MGGSRMILALCFLTVYCECAPAIDWNDIRNKITSFKDKVIPVAQGACGVLNGIQPSNPYQSTFPQISPFNPEQSSRQFYPQQQFPTYFSPSFPRNNFQHVPQFPSYPRVSRFPQAPRFPQFPSFPQSPRFRQTPGFPVFHPYKPSVPQVPQNEPPISNGIDNISSVTEREESTTNNQRSLPEVPPYIPPSENSIGDSSPDNNNGTSRDVESNSFDVRTEQEDLNGEEGEDSWDDDSSEDEDSWEDGEDSWEDDVDSGKMRKDSTENEDKETTSNAVNAADRSYNELQKYRYRF